MLRRSGSGLLIFCSVYWVNLIRYWDRLNQCQLGQYHYNKSVGARGVGKLGGGIKHSLHFTYLKKKGLAKRNPMVAGTKARESMEFFERSSELIHVFFSKVKTKIRSMKNKGVVKLFWFFLFYLYFQIFFFFFFQLFSYRDYFAF